MCHLLYAARRGRRLYLPAEASAESAAADALEASSLAGTAFRVVRAGGTARLHLFELAAGCLAADTLLSELLPDGSFDGCFRLFERDVDADAELAHVTEAEAEAAEEMAGGATGCSSRPWNAGGVGVDSGCPFGMALALAAVGVELAACMRSRLREEVNAEDCDCDCETEDQRPPPPLPFENACVGAGISTDSSDSTDSELLWYANGLRPAAGACCPLEDESTVSELMVNARSPLSCGPPPGRRPSRACTATTSRCVSVSS